MYWDHLNQIELTKREEELLEDIKNDDLKESIERIVKENKIQLHAEEKADVPDPVPFKVQNYDWQLADEFPVEGAMRSTTIQLLNLFKSMDESGTSLDLAQREEMARALTEFNKNSGQAKEVLEYLFSQSEVQESDKLTANLLKVTGYVNITSAAVIELAEQVMTTNYVNPSATRPSETDSNGQIVKIHEASRIIMELKSDNKIEAIDYVRNALTNHHHPHIPEELLKQLGTYFPQEAKELRALQADEGSETLKDYFHYQNGR